jgi:hypothetical protein
MLKSESITRQGQYTLQMKNRQLTDSAVTSAWGHLFWVCVLISVGLLTVAFSYRASRAELPMATTLYWVGLMVQFVPVVVRFFSPTITRKESIGLVVFLGITLYLTKILTNPLGFAFVDEFQQWRSAYDSLAASTLFVENPILEVSPYFPGLQNVTHAIVSLTGLSIFQASVIQDLATRIMFMLAIYLFNEEISDSPRFSGFATLIYICNPAFLGFSSYYTYQSLALPLSVLALYCIIRLKRISNEFHVGLVFSLIILIPAITITHHITSFIFVGFLMLFAFVPQLWQKTINKPERWDKLFRFVNRINPHLAKPIAFMHDSANQDENVEFSQQGILSIALLTFVIVFLWIIYVAPITLSYLGGQMGDIIGEIVTLFTSGLNFSKTFVPPDRPPVELIVGIASLLILLIGLPWGMLKTYQKYRANTLTTTMIVGSTALYFSFAIRFVSHRGGELLSRIWPFLYLLIGLILGIGLLVLVDLKSRWRWPARAGVLAAMIVLFTGGIANGWPPYWSRLPGKYLVLAAERSVDPHSLAAAYWTRDHLGTNNKMASDFILHHILGGYGLQAPVLGLSELFLDDWFSDYHIEIIRYFQLEYLVVDKRLAESAPYMGFYFGYWESETQESDAVERRRIMKFDGMEGVSRIYDSDSIVIYDIHRLLSD